MNLITIDQAFSDEHFSMVEEALFQLNKRGVYDPTFFLQARAHVKSKESQLNFIELTNISPAPVLLLQ